MPASFVGQDAELEVSPFCWPGRAIRGDRWRRSYQEILVGGKSRLLAEVRYRITGRRLIRLQGRQLDALTSPAVVAAGIGAAWVDAVAGLVVAGGILWLLARSARRMWRRVLDGIEPEIVDDVEATIRTVDRVRDVTDLRVRWHGHQLRIAASIAVDADLTVKVGHDTAHDVPHALHHRFTFPITAVIYVDPHGHTDAHDTTAHHSR